MGAQLPIYGLLCVGAAALLGGAAGHWLGRRKLAAAPLNAHAADPILDATGCAFLVFPPTPAGPSQPILLAGSLARAELAKRTGADINGPGLERLFSQNDPDFTGQIKALTNNGQGFVAQILGFDIIGEASGAWALVKIIIAPQMAQHLSDLSHAPILAWRLDPRGKLIWANDAYLSAVEANHLDEAGPLAANVAGDEKAALAGTPILGRHNFVLDGRRRTYDVLHQPLDGGVVGLAFDITRDADALARLHSEARAHEATLNQLTDAVAVFDNSQQLVFYNQAFAKLWKLEEPWLAQKPDHGAWLNRLRERGRLTHRDDFNEWRAKELSHYHADIPKLDDAWTLPDGRILRVARQQLPQGGLLLLFEDKTNETALEARFRTQLEVQRTTLDRLAESIGVFASDGTIRLANEAFLDLWGLDVDAPESRVTIGEIGEGTAHMFHEDGHFANLRARICDPSPQSRLDGQGEVQLRDGRVFRWMSRPLPDGATLIAHTNITDSALMAERMEKEKAESASLASMRVGMINGIARQLKNPLNALLGYLDMLTMDLPPELESQKPIYIKNALTAAHNLEEISNKMLELAALQARQSPLKLADVHISDIMTEVAENAPTSPHETSVKIEIDVDKDVPVFRGDGTRIRQMLEFLVRQAMESASGDDAWLQLSASMRQDAICLCVADNGPPVPPEQMASVFKSIETGGKRGGTAFVLVHQWANMHGGWVAMSSHATDCTRVFIHLPLAAKVSAAEPEFAL